MKRREMSYDDYDMTYEQAKELKERCRRLDNEDDHINLLLCAMRANKGIAYALYYSLVSGTSYDRISDDSDIPISKTDFYAYQRYCLSLFRDTRKEQQMKIVFGPF